MKAAYNTVSRIKAVFFSVLLLSWISLSHAGWQPIAPGIDFQDLGGNLPKPWSHIYVFRVDLTNNQLSLKLASDLDETHSSILTLGQDPDVTIAINGGFFDKNFRPLGLLISDGITKNNLKQISWWSVFYIHNGKPYIVSANQHIPSKASFAVQSGPQLLVNGRIPSLKDGLAERSALGIIDDKHIIILVTDNYRLSTKQLAKIMKNKPLSCRNALNLDGGSSSQLLAKARDFNLTVHGFSNISDAILVKNKKK